MIRRAGCPLMLGERSRKISCGVFEREKQKTILRELIAKTKNDKLNWEEESFTSNIYAVVWRGVKTKLWATESSIGDTYARYSLDVDVLEPEHPFPLFPIEGKFSYKKLPSSSYLSPKYSVSKEGHHELLEELYMAIKRQLESVKWLQRNSLSIAREFLGKMNGNPVENLSVDKVREAIIKEVSKRMTQIEWRVNYGPTGPRIYSYYIGSLGKVNIEVEKDVPGWFSLIVEISKKKRVLIQGHKDRGDQQLQIPDKKSKFYGALRSLYGRVDRRYQKLAQTKRKAEAATRIHNFLFPPKAC